MAISSLLARVTDYRRKARKQTIPTGVTRDLESHTDEVEGKKAIGLMAELTGLAKLRHV
jgi:hypothetical protein